MPNGPVVILTALNLEYQAVRRKLASPHAHLHERGTRFEVGTVQGTSCRVALGLTNKGNHSAAVIAERAIQEFSPHGRAVRRGRRMPYGTPPDWVTW